MENPTHCHSLPIWLLGVRVALFKFRQVTSTAVPSGCWSPVICIHLSLHEFPYFHLLRCESLWAYSQFSLSQLQSGSLGLLPSLPTSVLFLEKAPKTLEALLWPMGCSTPGFPVLHHLLELAQTHVCWVSNAIQPSHHLSSTFPPAFSLSQHQGLF